ncbi:MAG: bifunctional folylpolyglutamate synthase/dihydrofolate synthase [Chloroflexi bacterium]|nr:bifunctional folylpolyglutamate synthase/dihydrofolate synthase [Chloroflexota bacterium]
MDYATAIQYLESFTNYEKLPSVAYSASNFDLRRMEWLLLLLGNPERAARGVHIVGSKGKGSVAAMVASGLMAAGYRTGLYTSPHLHSWRERIVVDGEPISPEEMVASVAEMRDAISGTRRRRYYGALTTFEILTGLAFRYFRARGVQFQVVEAGLGGRLDATNVFMPEVCIFSPISLEHTAILGDTVALIAREKAGVIKPGVTVVSAPQPPEAAEVIRAVCRERDARLIIVGREVTWRKEAGNPQGLSGAVKGLKGEYRLHLPLLGDHQLENAAAAVAALEALEVRPEAIVSGLAGVRWPGRLEVLSQRPWVVVDGAHNGASAARLGKALQDYFNFKRLILIIGTSVDKDMVGMAAELAPLAHTAIVTRARHPRAAGTGDLRQAFALMGRKVQQTPSVKAALAAAQAQAGAEDLILVTGSLFVVAEAREYFHKEEIVP